jgi:hypothetical protein
MVFGGLKRNFQLNENRYGQVSPMGCKPNALKTLPQVQSCSLKKIQEAEKLAQANIMGTVRRDEKSSYQTSATSRFRAGRDVTGYRRELNIEEAVARGYIYGKSGLLYP